MKNPKDYKSIIWLRLDSIGDNILSSSMLPYIKEKFCNASITVVCQELISELYKECQFVDDIVIVPSEGDNNDHERFRDTPGRIKAKNPDLLLNSVFSVHYLSDMNDLEFIPERFAFDKLNRGKAYTNIVSDKGQWELELLKYRRFLDALGITYRIPLQPEVYLSVEDISKAKGAINNVDKFIVLFAGVRTIERFYDKYWEALKGLDCFVVALGAKKDYEMNQNQLDKSGCKGINLSGKLLLRESIAVIKLAKLAIGGETGLAHAACAVYTPNIVLLGGGHYGRFMPYGSLTTIIENKMNCFKCNWVCTGGKDFACIKGIEPLKIRKIIEGKIR